MDTITCIKTRRSVRKFKQESISKDIIEDLVLDASYAPSWKNTQTTRYIAITDAEIKAKLAEECCAEHNRGIINGAPLLIATLIVDKRSGFERDGSVIPHLEKIVGRHLTMALLHRHCVWQLMTKAWEQ